MTHPQGGLQPADFETADYRSVLRRLTTLDEEAAVLRDEAQRWHDGRVAAADEAVRGAEAAVAEAKEAVAQAQRELEEVDARAANLWSEYVHKVGPTAERYGRTVPPASIPRQRTDRDAGDYLDEVATKVKYTAPARPINSGVKVLFIVFGFLGGVAGAIGNQVLRENGAGAPDGTWKDALPVVALLVLLACPVLAVVAAKRVADRRGAGLDAATVATVLITGLVTAGVLVAVLRTT
ncbi:hypothetical protein [Paractinoplanes brasiliensis]|uniref:Uncharacterized protein n=1 Tax=Paractinoplanes brasiliensis TaxID=52695 RepID=A0A4R6J6W4_9ACTN|nr:hypothetical protein [Actinoplanes brasiliensis]TDO31229.1 hypothetical protein C8E87_6641 [Actinoplanes brasiliensis]GID28455.1 hypothetical protein Abr02nite_34380 [Actinoplanes brasiliensis]